MAQRQEKSREEVEAVFEKYTSVISYVPIAAEVNPFTVFPELESRVVYTIAPNRELDPEKEALAALRAASASTTSPAILLLPGREFDASGTRHGKGFGWYDRFLSMVPKDWLRIGFCFSDQFSEEPLVRESWDAPMDFVCVVDKTSGIAIFHETHARVY